MATGSGALRRQLESLREQVRQTEAALSEALIRESLDAKASVVYGRMRNGDVPVHGISGLWWANNGSLLCRLTDDEISGLDELQKRGVVERCRKAA